MKTLIAIVFIVFIASLSFTSCGSEKSEPPPVKKWSQFMGIPTTYYHGSGIFKMANISDISHDLESFINTNKKVLKPLSVTLIETGRTDTIITDSTISIETTQNSYLLFCEIKSRGYIKNTRSWSSLYDTDDKLVDSLEIY